MMSTVQAKSGWLKDGNDYIAPYTNADNINGFDERVLATTSRNAHLGTWVVKGLLGTTGRAAVWGVATIHFYGDGTLEGQCTFHYTFGGPINNYEWGIDANQLKSIINGLTSTNGKSCSISSMTPVTGGTWTPLYGNGYMQVTMFGYGGCFQNQVGRWWLPARMYTNDGDIGGWSESTMAGEGLGGNNGTFVGTWKGTIDGITVS